MTDYSELKRLAEAAKRDQHDYAALNDYGMAMPPAVALALIAEIERYRQYGCDTCDGSGHLHRIDGEYCGACTSCGAHELEQAKRERDQLKAENERLHYAVRHSEACFRLELGESERLRKENEALRSALTYIRDTSDDWHVCEKAADALVDAGKTKWPKSDG